MLLQKQISELLRPPSRVPSTVRQDQLLNGPVGQVRIVSRATAQLMQPGRSALLVAGKVLVAGFASNAKVMTQLGNRVFSAFCAR